MKKIIAIITVIALALTLSACSLPTETIEKVFDAAESQMNQANELQDKQNELADKIFNQIEENMSEQKENSDKLNELVDDFLADKDEVMPGENCENPEILGGKNKNSFVDNSNNTFYNASIDGRWVVDSISVLPKSAKFENGKLVMVCFIVNGYSTTATNLNVKTITVCGENEKLYAKGSFPAQNLTIAPLSYVEHTFTFSDDAIKAYGADLSHLVVDATFSLNH